MGFKIPSINITTPSINLDPSSYGIPTTEDILEKVMKKAPNIDEFPKAQELADNIKSKVPNADEYINKGKEVMKIINGGEPDLKALTGIDIPDENSFVSGTSDLDKYANIGDNMPELDDPDKIEQYFKSLSL